MKFKLFPWLIGFLLLLVIFFASFSPPSVTQIDPAENQNKVTFDAPFTVHFSHAMNRSSAEGAFQLLPKTKGEFKWKDLKTLEFYPDEPLMIGDEYRLVIKGEAKSLWMKRVGFDTTINYLVTGPPYVLFAHPTEDSVLAKNGVLTIMFDRAMDWDSVDQDDLIELSPDVGGEIRTIGMSAFQFIPKKLSSGKSYKVTIAAGLSALDGGLTKDDFTWTVSTASLGIEKTVPENNISDIAVNQSIEIHFDDEVSLEGIKPGVNALLYPSNDLDAGTEKKLDGFFNTEVTYGVDDEGEANRNVLVFSPTFPYQTDERYEFVLKADADLPLEEDFKLEFETLRTKPEEVRSIPDFSGEIIVEDEVEEGEVAPIETVLNPLAWEKSSMDFFIRGENPRLEIAQTLKEPATLSACQIPSNQFIRVSAKQAWSTFGCESDPVILDPSQKDLGTTINLNDHFKLDWVTGVYFASLTQGEKTIHKLFMVEDSTLLLKRSDSELFVWALDVKSGDPIADMELEILSYDGEAIMQGKTDESGIFMAKKNFEEGIYVRGKKEVDGMSRWGLVFDRWLSSDQEQFSQEDSGLYVFLNQSIFSPGETIQVKGIWRAFKNHVLTLPDSTQVTVTIEDSQQNFIGSKRIPLRRNGSFDSSIALPEDSVSGYYWLTVSDLNHQKLINPIALEVKDETSDLQLEWVEADRNHATGTAPLYIVKARYENGIPAAKLRGHLELFRKPTNIDYEDGATRYAFSSLGSSCQENCEKRTLVTSQSFEFDLNGEAKLLLTDEKDEFLLDGYDYYLQVKAFLPGKEKISLNHSFKIHQGSFDLGIGLKHALIQSNESIEASVLSLDHHGQITPDKRVKISLISRDEKRKEFYENSFDTGLSATSVSIPLDSKIPDGVYLLRAKSQDEKRNEILTEQLVFLSRAPSQAIGRDLLLAADQTKYFVGGRAHLLINEPEASEDQPIPVVVTYERDELLGYETLNLTAPVTKITVPIKESMMPHFLVNVTRFHRGLTPSFSSTSQRIDVGNDETEIFVDLSLEPENPEPGEEVTVKLRTYDYQDRPLSTVVTLNVLTQSPPELEFSHHNFYPNQAKHLMVASNISLNDPLNTLPNYQGSDEALLLNPAKSKYFDPLITTSEGGQAEVIFTLPNNREDLFFQAIATKDSGQFGAQSSVLKMNKKLSIQAILPSFAAPGDQTIFAASVKNISDEEISSRLELISPDTAIRGDTERNFSLQPGQQTEIAFTVFVDGAIDKDALVAQFKSGDDQTEIELPLRHLKSSMKVVNAGLLGDIWTGRIHTPQGAYPGLGNLELTMSGGPLAIAKVQAKALENINYQSTYLLAAKLISKLSFLDDEASEAELLSTRSLVSALLKEADENGAYRFWNEPSASPFLTALTLLAYKEASDLSVHVDSLQLNRTIDTLWKMLDERSLSLEEQTFILWVLAKNGQYDTERALSYFQDREGTSPKAKAFLLMNLNQLLKAGQGSITPLFETLRAELVDEIIQEEDLAYFDGPMETTAIVLFALSEIDSANPLLAPMANYIVTQGGDLILELDQEEALWTIMSLKSFVEKTKTPNINYIAQVKLNGALILDQSVTGNTAEEIYQSNLDADILNTNDINDIFVKKNGVGPLYLDAHLTSYLDPREVSATEEGMLIIRKLYEVVEDGKKIPASTFKKGTSYISELLIIVPKDYRYIALSDEIPAGMKTNPGALNLSGPFSQSYLDAGRVTYYAPFLPAGVYKISTEIQAILPGNYLHLPASIQPMFEPSVKARTVGGNIQIID